MAERSYHHRIITIFIWRRSQLKYDNAGFSFMEGRKRSYKISFVAFWYETRLHCWYDHSVVRFTLDLLSCLLYSTFNKTIRRNQKIRSSSATEKYDDAINRFADFPKQKCYFLIWRITHINDSFLWLTMKNFKIQKLCQPRKLYTKVHIENSNWSLWSK